MRRFLVLLLLMLMLAGCSLIFYAKRCAPGPKESLEGLFAAFNSTESLPTDIEKPPASFTDIFDIKKIISFLFDPRKLLFSFGGGDDKRGWEELKFLKNLGMYHNASGYEFQEYKVSVVSLRLLPSSEPWHEVYEVEVNRTDILLDMRDDNHIREVRMYYRRTFVAEFTEGKYCLVNLRSINEWKEVPGEPN